MKAREGPLAQLFNVAVFIACAGLVTVSACGESGSRATTAPGPAVSRTMGATFVARIAPMIAVTAPICRREPHVDPTHAPSTATPEAAKAIGSRRARA